MQTIIIYELRVADLRLGQLSIVAGPEQLPAERLLICMQFYKSPYAKGVAVHAALHSTQRSKYCRMKPSLAIK